MFGRKRHKQSDSKLDEITRLLRLQGEAHSAIMHQIAATQQAIRTEVQGLHERISFNNRPKP